MIAQEVKFIIVKDKIKGNLKHYSSDWLHHSTIARDNGYSPSDIIESGLFLDKQLFILESNQSHILKHSKQYIGNCLNVYHNERLALWLKGRELESQVYYKSNPILRQGD